MSIAPAPSSPREFFENYLGCRLTEQIVLNDGREAAMWLTMSNKSYDFAYSLDHSGTPGRFHHVTYALDSREEILRAADIFLENGIHIETGPHKHAIQQTFFLYVYDPAADTSLIQRCYEFAAERHAGEVFPQLLLAHRRGSFAGSK